MRVFEAIKPTKDSNTIVKELNAKVLSCTFKNEKHAFCLAEVCTYDHRIQPDEIIKKGSCKPIRTRVKEVILLDISILL